MDTVQKFRSIDYLKNGTPKQKRIYAVLMDSKVFKILKPFNPLLAGTIPLGIDIDSSDLDLLCFWGDKANFIRFLNDHFASKPAFSIREKVIGKQESIICSFNEAEFEIEIFGQNIPSHQQHAFLHMLVEYRILEEMGEAFKAKIIELKKSGLKTEPAFALALNLEGNPYQSLLDLYYK